MRVFKSLFFIAAGLIVYSAAFAFVPQQTEYDESSFRCSLRLLSVTGMKDTMCVRYSIYIEDGVIASGKAVVLQPGLEQKDGYMPFRPVSVYSFKAVPSYGKIYASGNAFEFPIFAPSRGMSFEMEEYVPYRKWMDSCNFTLRMFETGRKGSLNLLSVSELASVKKPSASEFKPEFRLVEPSSFQPDTRRESLKYDFRFAPKVTKFDLAYGVNESEAQRMEDELTPFMNVLSRYPGRTLVSVCCWDAPGEAKDDVQLSHKRGKAVTDYLVKKGILKSGQVAVVDGGYAWPQFVEWVEASKWSDDEEVMELITGAGNIPDIVKELKKKKATFWEAADSLCFPEISGTDMVIEFSQPYFRSSDAAYSGFMAEPRLLGLHDFWLAASGRPFGGDDCRAVIDECVSRFPGDEIANLNAMTMCLASGNIDGLSKYMSFASRSPEFNYLCAVMDIRSGRYKEAMETISVVRGLDKRFMALWNFAKDTLRLSENNGVEYECIIF